MYNTIGRIAATQRRAAQTVRYDQLAARMSIEHQRALDGLLDVASDENVSDFTRLKTAPGPVSLKSINAWAARLTWMSQLLESNPIERIEISQQKISQFAAEARPMEVGDLKDVRRAKRRRMLLAAFIHQQTVTTRDQLADARAFPMKHRRRRRKYIDDVPAATFASTRWMNTAPRLEFRRARSRSWLRCVGGRVSGTTSGQTPFPAPVAIFGNVLIHPFSRSARKARLESRAAS